MTCTKCLLYAYVKQYSRLKAPKLNRSS